MSVECVCGKKCKTLDGLKTHQPMMKCLVKEQVVQCRGATPGEMQEELGLKDPHSTWNLCAPETSGPSISSEQWQDTWPPASRIEEQCQYNEHVNRVLENCTRGCRQETEVYDSHQQGAEVRTGRKWNAQVTSWVEQAELRPGHRVQGAPGSGGVWMGRVAVHAFYKMSMCLWETCFGWLPLLATLAS